jgi:hypothetical protein
MKLKPLLAAALTALSLSSFAQEEEYSFVLLASDGGVAGQGTIIRPPGDYAGPVVSLYKNPSDIGFLSIISSNGLLVDYRPGEFPEVQEHESFDNWRNGTGMNLYVYLLDNTWSYSGVGFVDGQLVTHFSLSGTFQFDRLVPLRDDSTATRSVVSPIPEPETYALFLSGILLLAARRRARLPTYCVDSHV